jgi:hypothetical protein
MTTLGPFVLCGSVALARISRYDAEAVYRSGNYLAAIDISQFKEAFR